MLRIEFQNTGGVFCLLGAPVPCALTQDLFHFLFRKFFSVCADQVEPPVYKIQANQVVFLHQCDGTALCCLGRDMSDGRFLSSHRKNGRP